MKKATLTIGLLTLVMVLTSFTTPETTTVKVDNTTNAFIDKSGGQSAGGNRKVDYNGNGTIVTSTNQIAFIDKSGGQSAGGNRKVD